MNYERYMPTLRQAVAVSSVTLLALFLGVALTVVVGLYSVAASAGHFGIVEAFLELALARSVSLHARAEPPSGLAHDRDRITLGAAHFDGACSSCHGAPGRRVNPLHKAMLPPPPHLSASDVLDQWQVRELFWILKHGIKYTGMPAWPNLERDDEVWTLVAFLQNVQVMEPAEYRRLRLGNAAEPSPLLDGDPEFRTVGAIATACTSCHDNGRARPPSELTPSLAGQSATYLADALHAYADGTRASGIMEPVAAVLDDAEIALLAEHFSGLEPIAPVAPRQQALWEQGRRIATTGLPEADVPACLSCHDAHALETFPRLSGQNARYLRTQLALWRDGGRRNTAAGRIMAVIAQRLDADASAAVSHYFEQHRLADPPRGPDA